MTEAQGAPAPDENRITEYNATEAGLARLRDHYAGVIFDCSDANQDKEARAARQELVKLRTSLESKRKTIKEPALRMVQLIDAEARRITAEIRKLEDPIDSQIKTQEQKIAAEKLERERRELARIESIKRQIAQFDQIMVRAAGKGSADIRAALNMLSAPGATDPDVFQEFTADAVRARDAATVRLNQMYDAAVEAETQKMLQEAEAKRLRAQAEENARKASELAAMQAAIEARERAAAAAAASARPAVTITAIDPSNDEQIAQWQRDSAGRLIEQPDPIENLGVSAGMTSAEPASAIEQPDAIKAVKNPAADWPFDEARRAPRTIRPNDQAIVNALSAGFDAMPLDVIGWLETMDFPALRGLYEGFKP